MKKPRERWATVPEIIADCARYRPHIVVLADGSGREVTAAALLDRVRRGACALSGQPLGRGDFVAIDTASLGWIDTAIAYFSVVWLGAVAVLVMDPAIERIARERIGAKTMISAGPDAPGRVSAARLATGQRSAAPAPVVRDDLLDIVFTSGTTGAPKPVASTHAQWTGSVRPEMMMSRARRVVGHTGIPIGVSGGLHGVLLSHLARGVSSLSCRTVAELYESCHRWRVGELHLTPHSARALARFGEPDEEWAKRVTIIRVIGGPLPAAVAGQLAQRFPRARVVSMYGLTEGGAAMFVKEADRGDTDSIGRPVQGTQARIVDAAGRELPPGKVGEVVVRDASRSSMTYYQDEVLSRAWFRGGWARTGDLGFKTAAGQIRLVGRDRELIVLRGGRIGPELVEEILSRRMPEGIELSVVGMAAAGGWDRIAVFLEGEPGSPGVTAAVQGLTAMKGPFRPHAVRVVPRIPRGPFGKPLRRLLAQQLTDGEQVPAT